VFTDSDAIIAVGQDGGDIPVDQGGPIRIVFPDGTPGSTRLEAWNWSIERIEVM
jgi:DMSO/TMAO reductase YedYZ molybdopterin-dependent catalytic subunit